MGQCTVEVLEPPASPEEIVVTLTHRGHTRQFVLDGSLANVVDVAPYVSRWVSGTVEEIRGTAAGTDEG